MLEIFISLIIIILGLFILLSKLSSDLLILIIGLELLLLGLSSLFLIQGIIFDDQYASIKSLKLLPIAGCESAIYLSKIISLYPKKSNLDIS